MSRQTIYNHFDSKQEIIERALAGAASNAAERIIAAARSNASAAGFVVELCVSALHEYTRNPAISPVIAIVQASMHGSRCCVPKGSPSLGTSSNQSSSTCRTERTNWMK